MSQDGRNIVAKQGHEAVTAFVGMKTKWGGLGALFVTPGEIVSPKFYCVFFFSFLRKINF